MVGDLAFAASFGSITHSELSLNHSLAYFDPSFVEDFHIPLTSNLDPLSIDRPETSEKEVEPKIGLCDAVLKYINRVLMENDDFEEEDRTIKGLKLDAIKRSFHEIIVGNKHHNDTSDDLAERDTEIRKSKFIAADESAIHHMFGKIVLSYGKNKELALKSRYNVMFRKGFKKRDAIDMRNLLLQCTEFVAISDHNSANKLMKEIRSRSCSYGDGTQRMAHCIADGLQARLDGLQNPQHQTLAIKALSDAEILKAFKLFFTDFPFAETAYFFANQMIIDLVDKTTNTLHIIHFGIMHGLQWPPLIQRLSQRPGGPPKLRITGIDFPQPGFRPDARVKETGCQLASYCKEFNVPFEYNSFAMNWDTVKPEDLKLKKDEMVIVNCMYHFMYLLDDSVMENNPRDNALNLIKTINPSIFIHVIVNGTYNSPFFTSRFKEALFYFSSWFEMFDAVLPLNSPGRMVFERDVWGQEVMNIVASEGLERVERPETYKQWHKRTIRAGFKPLPLNKKIVSDIRARVKFHYHKDFFVDEAGSWLLDGWKGKALFALSCWKAAA